MSKAHVINRDPVYRTLQNELRLRVRQGHWTKGSLIPSRRALADEFQVSVPTVQKAISDMVAEGLLRVNAKRGTYVFGDSEVAEPKAIPVDLSRKVKRIDGRSIRQNVGSVGLLADLRPGESFGLASAWPYVILNEAEHALTQLDIASRFYNRFDLARRVEGPNAKSNDNLNVVLSRQMLDMVLLDKPVALIFYESILNWPDSTLIDQAMDAGVLAIVVGGRNYGPECVSIMYDHCNAGFQATRHLIERGCRRLLFFSGYSCDWEDLRLRGARLAMKRAGLSPNALRVAIGPQDVEVAVKTVDDVHPHIPFNYAFAQGVLAQGFDEDGVVAINDDSAIGFIKAADEIGMTAGEDYSIIGFDDSPDSQIMGLSTMHPPCVAMGREAGQAVARFMNGDGDLSSVTLKSRLVVRASSSQRR